VKRVHSPGSVLDKKYTGQNAVLTEEMLDEIGATFQVIEEGDYERRAHFCNWFLHAVHNSVLDAKLTFFTDEVWFHLSGYISAENNRYWNSINLKQTF
jgi:hypothetical protein